MNGTYSGSHAAYLDVQRSCPKAPRTLIINMWGPEPGHHYGNASDFEAQAYTVQPMELLRMGISGKLNSG